ncbi:MAG TPA: hypothetical protein VGV59_19605 [Pyrinomonadaceae bacterium]|nr:hypothetical protein [Pyrinomonadaceae bacterium]
MKPRLQKAIRNNNGLYEALFNSRQIKFSRTDSIWYSTEQTPPLYSNLVTLSSEWKPDAVFRAIDLHYEKEKWDEWSLKDSFGVLDLRAEGFAKLFDAQWVYLDAASFIPGSAEHDLSFAILTREDALAAWSRAWDDDERLGEELFDAKLLNNQKVHFVAGYSKAELVCGCLVNQTDDVLGISNLFAPGADVGYWSGLIDFIRGAIARLDIVGYERHETAERLRRLGFEPIGKLTVWLKKRET